MSREKSGKARIVAAVVIAAAVGGVAIWKLRGPDKRAATPAEEVARERQRVAAFDPSFDPAKPSGGIAGVVRDGDGQPIDGAIVAIIRNRGKDELPTFTRPSPRTTVSAGGGRFRIDDVLPGEYGVTATALEWAPARQGKVEVSSGKTTEVTLNLGKGGALFTGEALDVGGGAVGGAKAVVRGTGFMNRPGEAAMLFQATADDRGIFKVQLAPGEYEVTVKAEGYAPARDRLFF